MDGDIIVADLRRETTIKGKRLHTLCQWSPYENYPAIFPRLVTLRGEVIVKDDNLEGDAGIGKMIT